MITIFGAGDHEQVAAQGICTAAGVPYAYAMADGRRVHPGNAYRADAVSAPVPAGCGLIVFECGGAAIDAAAATAAGVVRCDHHRPGDPGYGRPPAEFWPASSIGQLANALGVPPTSGTLMVAAADHCLAAAYRGECPGVDPESLMWWRAQSRAAFQRRPVEDVLDDIQAARRELWRRGAIAAARHPDWNEFQAEARLYGDLRLTWRDFCGVLDFGDATVPELPEAASREGVAYVATVTERDGRRKRVLGAASPEQVRDWMAGEGAALVDIYGDPERGFAGGYLP